MAPRMQPPPRPPFEGFEKLAASVTAGGVVRDEDCVTIVCVSWRVHGFAGCYWVTDNRDDWAAGFFWTRGRAQAIADALTVAYKRGVDEWMNL